MCSIIFFACLGVAIGSSLRDHPIAGNNLQYLDSNWTATDGQGLVLQATVPGDLITDLENNGVIG